MTSEKHLKTQHTISFSESVIEHPLAVAVVADLEGFTRFCNDGRVEQHGPQYLSLVFKALDIALSGGEEFWTGNNHSLSGIGFKADHCKFVGDGAVYVFSIPEETDYKDYARFTTRLLRTLVGIRESFEDINRIACEKMTTTRCYPQNIRFGIAQGKVYELKKEDGSSEFVGTPINLASRLQGYCNEIGVITAPLTTNGSPPDFTRLTAKHIRGFPEEYVYVPEDLYNRAYAKHAERIDQLFVNPNLSTPTNPEKWLLIK